MKFGEFSEAQPTKKGLKSKPQQGVNAMKLFKSRKAKASKDEQGNSEPQKLPPAVKDKHFQQLNTLAKQILGITVKPARYPQGEQPAAIFKSGPIDERSVAVHLSDYRLRPYQHADEETGVLMPGLFRAFSYKRDFSILLSSVPAHIAEFERHLSSMEKEVSDAHRQFLNAIREWAGLAGLASRRSRYLWIWGASDAMVPKSPEDTLGLRGHVIRYPEAGPAIRAAIHRLPLEISDLTPDPTSKEYQHLVHAAPLDVVFRWSHYEIENRAFAFWKGHNLTPSTLKAILAGPFDALMRLEFSDVDKKVYVTYCVRAETNVRDLAAFDKLSDLLHSVGKFERVKGWNAIKTAFQAFLPGSAPLPESWFHHVISVKNTKPILQAIADAINVVGDQRGTLLIGKSKGQPYLVNPTYNPSMAFIGPSKMSGKSTTSAVLALHHNGRRLIWMPLTLTEGDSAPNWTKRFEGTVVELPDVTDAQELLYANRQTSHVDTAAVRQKQEELHIADRKVAENICDQLFDNWRKHGKVMGPVTFLPKGRKETLRLYNLYEHFLISYRILYKDWYGGTGEHCLVVVDNLSTLRELTEADAVLGRLPADVGRNLGTGIGWLISNGANIGIHTWILTHEKSDLEWIASGLSKHVGRYIMMGEKDEHVTARVENHVGEVLVDPLVITLPYPLLAITERREPGQQA